MLVRILAMGLSHPLWKNVFHHVRARLPGENFSAGYFSAPDELAYLEQEYFPHAWRREPPDLILTDAGAAAEWKHRHAFLTRVMALGVQPPPVLALTLHTLSHGLRQLVQGPNPVTLQLDNEARFSLTDPGLLLDEFPKDYPRILLNPHLTALRLTRGKGASREIKPQALPVGALVALTQVEAIIAGAEVLAPQDWLKAVLKAERAHAPRNVPHALYREQGGLFLFPGVPANRVRAITLGGLTFSPLIDLGLQNDSSPGFVALAGQVEALGRRNDEAMAALRRRIRDAENRTGLPVCCASASPALSALLAALLAERGFRRAGFASAKELPQFDEPALLLEPAAGRPASQPQREEPLVLAFGKDLLPGLALLDGFVAWHELPPAPLPEGALPDRKAFLEDRERLSARVAKARSGLDFTARRLMLLEQETEVLKSSVKSIEQVLGPGAALWSGNPPSDARQALVLAFDAEEAQVVFQSLPRVPKRRWLDLSPLLDPDSAHGFDLSPMTEYAPRGAVFITGTARERADALRKEWRAKLADSAQALDDAQAAKRQYEDEIARISESQRQLALRWMTVVLRRWLENGEARVLAALDTLRPRHEQSWFSRGQVNRIVLMSAHGENRKVLQDACREIFPHFNPSLSAIVPYDYEPLDALSPGERDAALNAAKAGKLPPAETERRLDQALAAENERLLHSYLEILATALSEVQRADLLLIEHRSGIAEKLLEHVRAAFPIVAKAPVILIVPDTWTPPEGGALPWPHTRVVPVRRMGVLPERECTALIRALFAL